MTPVLLLILLLGGTPPAPAPTAITVATPRGEAQLAIRLDSGAPAVAGVDLVLALNGTMRIEDGWAEVTIARQPFRFLLGAPFFVFNDQLEPLSAGAYQVRDTVFLPLQFIAEILPRVFTERFLYDAEGARLQEVGPKPVAATPPPPKPEERLPNGLRPGHLVTIDPGHGGIDPGNPGLYFPRGITEKNVTLQIGLRLREELKRRGIVVWMTRATDTLIALGDRGAYCSAACDLFVSLHVNSLKRRRGYTATRGFETYFLAEAKTEDAARVEQMENEAIRFEGAGPGAETVTGLDFILKDLQLNEYLRESARAAELVQDKLDQVHTGENRGVKQAGFMVLTTARRPAILAELGYSTNPTDGRYLASTSGQKQIATALADAIVAYLLEYEWKTGSPADSGRKP